MEYIVVFILGAVCIAIGIMNMMGNVSLIKYRHRRRVAPENMLAFGRMVGVGTIITGVGFLVSGTLFLLAELRANPALETAGGIATIIGAVVGLAIMFFAMIKYNKGIL